MLTYFDGAPPSDPFYEAFVKSVQMNRWAAGFTSLSVLALAGAT
jgi:hypothetical protein